MSDETIRERISNVGSGMTPTYHATESIEEARAVVKQCMSATDELRHMLDERGVEWKSDVTGHRTCFGGSIGDSENTPKCLVDDSMRDGMLNARILCITPEQAVEATLGRKRDERLAARMTDVMMRVERALGVDHGGAEVLSAEVAPLLREALEIIDAAATAGRGECAFEWVARRQRVGGLYVLRVWFRR